MITNKQTSNLFSNFDDIGTEANPDIIKNSIKINKPIKNQEIRNKAIEDLTNSKQIMEEITKHPKLTENKLDILAAKLPNKIVDKKSYMTIYLKKSVQVKIDEMAKKLGISNGSIIELLINEFEQK